MKNPVTVYLATVSIGSLCFVGITSLVGRESLLSLLAKPIVFACSILVVMYTLFSLRLGSISSIGNHGQVYHTTRKNEPIFFFSLVIFYMALSVPTTLYMAYLIILE